MSIFLPVAGVSLSLFYLIAIGTSVGVLPGLVGVGGGFLLTPALMMIGVPTSIAAASGSCQMIATSSSGVAAHFRLGNVDLRLGSLLLAGSLGGAAFGVQLVRVLRGLGEAGAVITLTYILVLGVLGAFMFVQSVQTLRRGTVVQESAKPTRTVELLGRLPWQVNFPCSGVRHAILVPLVLSILVGILATIMGVGGGFVMLPMMIYLLGMPTHVAVGTSLYQILFLCAGVTYMQATTNHLVDFTLALTLAVGSTVGAQAGARLSRYLRGEQLIILLAIIVLLVVGEMSVGLLSPPAHLLKPTSGQSLQASAHPVPPSSRVGP